VRAGGSFRAYARADCQTTRSVLRSLDEYDHLYGDAAGWPTGDDILLLCIEHRAFDDEGLNAACRAMRRPLPRLSNAQFDAKRDLDALRTAVGVRPATQANRMPSEPLEIAAAWMSNCVDY